MSKRNPVSGIQNIWFDSEQVDAEDLIVEQNYNNTIDSAIINNHIGSGIVPSDLEGRVLFDTDSLLNNPILDGVLVVPSAQPSDNNFGNQLEISLSGSNAAGRRAVKIAIIGLDFEQNLQYESFVFKTNESQVTKRHYTSVLQILINDFRGEISKSFNLGGRLLVKEANPLSISRSTLPIAQNIEPNLFWRDFFVSSPYQNLNELLSAGLSNYNIKSLNIIESTLKAPITFNPGNVTQQVGQKFKSNTNNIQKVTLLLSATHLGSDPVDYDWSGNIILSIYPLQTYLQCPTDLPPETLLGYPPSPVPLAQVSFDIDTLRQRGIVLNDVPQPVDFVFSNTPVGSSNSIVPGNYYAVVFKRAVGSTSTDIGEIYVHQGGKYVLDSVKTIFDASNLITSSNDWVDDNQADLWFEIHSSAAKITDGQAYLSGNGVVLEKTTTDQLTASVVDYCLDNLYFTGSDNFTAAVFAGVEKNTPVQDLRTGNLVYSRQKSTADVRLLSTIDLQSVEAASDPLLVGNVTDKNKKLFDSLNPTQFTSKLKSFSFFNNEIFVKIEDADSNELKTKFLSGDLVNTKISSPTNPSTYYVISSAELIAVKYGDLDRNGVVNEPDLMELRSYLGFDFNKTPILNSQITVSPLPSIGPAVTVTCENGYVYYTKPFKTSTAVSYYLADSTGSVIYSHIAPSATLSPDQNNPRRAELQIDFGSTPIPQPLVDSYVVISGNSNNENNGKCKIVGISGASGSVYNVIVEKILLNKDTVIQLFQSNLDTNKLIDNDDELILQSYIDKSSFIQGSTVNANAVGTEFEVLRICVENRLLGSEVDRSDDYFNSSGNRSESIHTLPDIAVENASAFLGVPDLTSSPIDLAFERQQSWEDFLVVSNSKAKFVPAVFIQKTDPVANQNVDGIQVTSFNSKSQFDPGKINAFVPDDFIIGNGGEIVREDGSLYKVDFEVGTIVLEIPPGKMSGNGDQKNIDLFDNFIKNYENSGKTRLGFPAMRFADGSFVETLSDDQVRFSVSVQSYSPTSTDLNSKLAVNVDHLTGVLKIIFENLYQDIVRTTISTRIQVNVFLKKGGFNNKALYVDSSKTANIINIKESISNPGSFSYKRPTYVSCFSGNLNISGAHADEIISGFTFRLDSFAIGDIESIYLEGLVKGSGSPTITLRHLNDDSSTTDVVSIAPASPMSSSSLVLRSENILSDIKDFIPVGKDHIYEIVVQNSESMTYQMVRLIVNS